MVDVSKMVKLLERVVWITDTWGRFPAYPPANQNPSNEGASSRTSTSGPSTSQQMSPTSQQIQFDFAVDVAFLFSLIDQNPDQNAELIRLLNTSTSGNVNDLNGENLDRGSSVESECSLLIWPLCQIFWLKAMLRIRKFPMILLMTAHRNIGSNFASPAFLGAF